MKKTPKYALICAVFSVTFSWSYAADQAKPVVMDCTSSHSEATKAISANPTKVLELVAKLVASNEQCAGEIVKAAILATNAEKSLVAQIVETAVSVAPKEVGEIVTFAIATAPDAKATIIASVVKLNGESGTGQAIGYDRTLGDPKSGDMIPVDPKAGVETTEVSGINPLDFPEGEAQFMVDPKSGASGPPAMGAPSTGPMGISLGGPGFSSTPQNDTPPAVTD